MIRFNKLSVITAMCCISLFISCNQGKNSSITSEVASDTESSTIYLSDDGQQEFVILDNSNSEDGKITVKDAKTNTTYNLQRVKSASGVKYENEGGYVLWTKADEFIWSKNEKTLAQGHLKTTQISDEDVSTSKFNTAYYGNYVDGSYAKKEEGYDWVSVIVKPIDDFKAKVSIRSRADKKKATCTFDGIANVSDENTLKMNENGLYIVIKFNANSLTIGTEPESDSEKLAFYCSGGASLANTYTKISGELDQNQIDKTPYLKSLPYNNLFFIVKGTNGEVTITPMGLTAVSTPETLPIKGEITNVEIGDLNNDTYPELLIYTTSGTDKEGEVIGYSVNNGKSMSMISIPNIKTLSEINAGYNGHDEFAMVEGTFVQRFPIYENNVPTGKIKQIQYKLENGEAMRQMVVDKVLEY